MRYINLLIVWLTLTACQEFDSLGQRVTEGVTFEVSTDLLYNPLILQFIDPRTGTAPVGLAVQVVDSDFSGVYTLDGRLRLTPYQGILPLGVRKDELRSLTEPKSVLIQYRADGYPVQEERFIVTDTLPRTIILDMEAGEEMGPVVDELRTDLTLQSAPRRSYTSDRGQFTLTFPRQSAFLDPAGLRAQGQATLRAHLYRNSRENRAFLRKQLTRQRLRSHEGGMRREINIEPLALLTLNLENSPIRELTYPVQVSIPLRGNPLNRLTGEPMRAGDQVPVFGYFEGEDYWAAEGLARVLQGDQGLVAVAWLPRLQPIALGWASFTDPDIESECILLVDVYADVAEPFSGVYRRDYQDTVTARDGSDSLITIKEEVFFDYAERPRLSFSAIFPNCATGNAQGLDGVIREAVGEVRAYFNRQDSLAFQGVTFQRQVGLFPVFRPAVCREQTDLSNPGEEGILNLTIRARADAEGFLRYRYADVSGFEYLRLRQGANQLALPYPDDVFLLDAEKATFEFTFQENCVQLSDGTETELCDLADGFQFDISPPLRRQGLYLEVVGETACNNVHNANVVMRPTLPILVREHCDQDFSPYRYLGYLKDGRFSGKVPLDLGKTYDFLLPLGESVTELKDIRLSTAEAVFNRNGQPILIEPLDQGLRIDLGVVDIPDAICNLLSGS